MDKTAPNSNYLIVEKGNWHRVMTYSKNGLSEKCITQKVIMWYKNVHRFTAGII